MAKILMRAGMSPLENISAAEVIFHNLIGENTGNMLFPYSIMRMLMREDTQITTIPTNRLYPAKQAAQWNEEYDFFVIPLANAFRKSFIVELGYITALVKKLDIPCIVIGAGVQAGTQGVASETQELDREVKAFIKEVLKKSAIIGIRGEITAQYLKRLGFVEDKDFTVIGCPSMYLHGPKLPLKTPVTLTPKTPVSMNCKIKIPAKLSQFVLSSAKRFEHYTYVPQGIDDLLLLYTGRSIDREKFPKIRKGYPWQLHSKICASGHELGFTDARSWIAFLNGVDFSFGTRIHGNIAAVLAGTPAFIFAPDGRILELARYHNIQHMLACDLTEDTDIFKVYEQADFSSVQRGHKERFAHYAQFLEQNGLSHIYMEGEAYGKSPFDEKMEQLALSGPVKPLHKIPVKEQSMRLQAYYAFLNETAAAQAAPSHKSMKKIAGKLPEPIRNGLIQRFGAMFH